VYVAGLRDPNTGRYAHSGLAQRYGEDTADTTIRHSHDEAFRAWLSLDPKEQQEDLQLYWSGLMENPAKVAATWRQLESYRTLPPASASEAEKTDYLEHMAWLLQEIQDQRGPQ
jgi:hypothetical protein